MCVCAVCTYSRIYTQPRHRPLLGLLRVCNVCAPPHKCPCQYLPVYTTLNNWSLGHRAHSMREYSCATRTQGHIARHHDRKFTRSLTDFRNYVCVFERCRELEWSRNCLHYSPGIHLYVCVLDTHSLLQCPLYHPYARACSAFI